jgi:putative metallopeptidase
MPRRSRAPKEPKVKVELVYEESDAVADVAGRLIRLFPAKFGWTTNFKLGYLLVHGSKAKTGDRDVAGKFRKVPPVYHGLTGLDAVVEIHAWAWNALNAEQQEALVAHELCHGSMSERGALRVEKHDLTEFHFVVGQYGAWQNDIATFAEQLSLFETRGGAFRAPALAQASLDDVDVKPKGEINTDELRGIADRSVVDEPTSLSSRRKNGQPPATPPLS